ncbi:MFS general substrate transporter [Setomelanomma holmii]|uniref:MFS general substrate transporter n=1 Tax=Setomelanomma holmii TaxID=210430 RepID=A0A9P4HDZ6_9PLEO|nr:MFS general substrate transporter [Setomelanomma holmii]
MFFTCIMFGFDSLAGGVGVSIVEFRKDFGHPYGGDYVVDTNWQLGFQAATLFGIIFGGLATSIGVHNFGRQPCILVAYIINTGGIFLQFFATTPAHFFGGKILTGLPLGCFSTVALTYATEIAPISIRGAITAGKNFAIVLGQLIGYGIMRQASFYEGNMTYRVLFAVQWGYVAVGMAVLPCFLEYVKTLAWQLIPLVSLTNMFVRSPYWLVAHGRHEKARHNLARVHSAGYDTDGHMAEIHDSLARQNAEIKTQGSLAECFSQKHIKRMLVATNAGVIGYMSYFMQLGGMSASTSFDMTVGMSSLIVVGNMCGWVFVEKFGRRATALYGTAVLTIALFIIGILACIKTTNASWGQIAFMAVWSFVYQGTVGSAAWPISAENPSSRLRAPTQSLATMMNGLSSCIWSFALPYATNPDQGNLGGKIVFIFGAVVAV